MVPDLHDPCLLYLGTEDGLRTARLSAVGLTVTHTALAGEAVRAIDVHPSDPVEALVGCGLRGHGLHRITDAGATVEHLGFEERWVWGIARDPRDPETVYVGTEPPMLFVSTDGGGSFDAFDGLEDLPSRSAWTFFHDPFRAGHVHGIALHPDRPDRILAGVEHGALVRSTDGGQTWDEALVGADVHRVAVHPTEPDRVYAATGTGLARSEDGGTTWAEAPPLRGSYLHALVFHPEDPARMYVYADDEDNPVHRSDDGGETWTGVADGLPAARPADPLRLHPTDPETVVYAGDAADDGSHLHASTDGGETWTRVEGTLPKVWRLEATSVPG